MASFKEADAALVVLCHPSSSLMPTAVLLTMRLNSQVKGRKEIIESVDLINYHGES